MVKEVKGGTHITMMMFAWGRAKTGNQDTIATFPLQIYILQWIFSSSSYSGLFYCKAFVRWDTCMV